MLTSKQLKYQIFALFDISKKQGTAMGLSDLLSIELHTDNLKNFNQEWEEMRLSLEKRHG